MARSATIFGRGLFIGNNLYYNLRHVMYLSDYKSNLYAAACAGYHATVQCILIPEEICEDDDVIDYVINNKEKWF